MDLLLRLITEYGLLLVFAGVLVQQLGVPLPAYPLMMLTSALAARGQFNVVALLGTAVAACLIADTTWYLIGRALGRRVLRLLCRISLSPDSCVRQTESVFTRFGPPSLTVAKFVPGFASVATALAGAMRIPRAPFLLFDLIGATLWVGVALALGWLFSPAIEDIVNALAQLGRWGVMLIALILALFIAAKWWQRHRFNVQLRMARLAPAALAELLDSGERPLIVDVRSAASRDEGRIPGAVALHGNDAEAPEFAAHPKDGLIVVYCACPNDASAVVAARKLIERGFTNVRPLAGGFDAWVAMGRGIEQLGSPIPPPEGLTAY
jgi:membrane protein DedA with SNARE-associated domain/rhodanese-related sulfurtransferase